MSRSFKKVPIIKDGGKRTKQIANRRLRRAQKAAVQGGKELIPLNKEVTNQYDVCDYKFRDWNNQYGYYERK